MPTKHYSKRFIAGLKRIYLIALPLMLVVVLLANNALLDAYYANFYTRAQRQVVSEVVQQWRQSGRLPARPGVRYRPLPPGTAPYAYYTEQYTELGAPHSGIWYVATVAKGREAVEVTVYQWRATAGGEPTAGIVLGAVAASLLLFLGLSWLLFQFSLKRVSFRLWQPFYQNLRRVNAFNLRDKQPLVLAPTDVREFVFFNEAITGFVTNTQRAYDELREFTENTAHELQTPLAVVLAKTELLLKRPALDARDRQDVLEIKQTVQRLSALQKALNLLSRVRALHHAGPLPAEPVVVDELLAETLTRYEELLDYRALTVAWGAPALPWQLHTNRELLGILLDNLVRNAIQHNPPGGRLGVQLLPAGGLVLRNTGAAPATAAPDPFRRYHSRSTDDGRLGLGLAIVQAISETLGLACRYQFEPEDAVGWHVFTLTLR